MDDKLATKEEVYAQLLVEQQNMEKTMKNIQTRMSSLLMNIKQENFNSSESHAVLELKYLVSGANKLSQQSYKVFAMAKDLFKENN